MKVKKIAIITGGSDGIGKAIAELLTKNNYFIVIIAKNKAKAEAVISTIGKEKTEFVLCDISDYSSVSKSVQSIIKKHRRVDVLINNAGVWIEGELEKNNPEEIKRAFEVNSIGQAYVTREVIPIMKKQKCGAIVNIVSQAGFYGKAERSIYTATKFAITGMTKSLEQELKKYGIKVIGIYPGKVRTELFSKVGIKKSMEDSIEPKDVAQAVLFVLSRPPNVTIPEIGIKNLNN